MPTTRKPLLREATLLDELAGAVGEKFVSTDPVELRAYARDQSWLARTGAIQGWEIPMPDVVVWPGSTEEVAAVLRIANRHRVPVVPYCGGAGVQGGTIPLHGGIILDTKRLDRVLHVDERNLWVTVQAGIIYQNLEWELNRHGLTLPHVPQSAYCSGIGGFLSTRAAGVLSTRYGKITEMVLGMEVVLPTGEVVRFRATPESSAGPDLKRLFMGAEGTLGVITEVTLQVWPQPAVRRFRGLSFPDLPSGLEAARLIMQRGLRPAAMRLSDELETMMLYKQPGCLMVLCFEGHQGAEELAELEEQAALRLCQSVGGTDLGPEPGEHWWQGRYSVAYPSPDNPILTAQGPAYPVGTVIDTAGSFDYLEKIHAAMQKAVYRFENTLFAAHFSHWYPGGGMMYPYVYNIGAPRDETMLDLYFRIQREAVRTILELGGTINHHHGIGLTLSGFMEDELGPTGLAALRAIKRALDPNGIMNPGKLGM